MEGLRGETLEDDTRRLALGDLLHRLAIVGSLDSIHNLVDDIKERCKHTYGKTINIDFTVEKPVQWRDIYSHHPHRGSHWFPSLRKSVVH